MKKKIEDTEKDVQINKNFKEEKLSLKDFTEKPVNEQFSILKEVLGKAYAKETKISKDWIISCIELSCSPKDEVIYLAKNLAVEKKKGDITFRFRKKRRLNAFLLGIYIVAFILGVLAATYWAVFYLSRADLNKDIDGDGIPDINLDLNNDGKAEINIDTNKDDKPDLNIDYKGNRKAVFNIDTDNDGIADYNLVNDATDGKVCSLNCDTNGDGWPDLNIDLDGDGIADMDIDTDGDGIADLNLDTNGDGTCNLMCDTNGDLICDEYCIGTTLDSIKQSGTTTITGNPNVDILTGGLVITYSSDNLSGYSYLPNDMSYSAPIPDKTFTIENTSSYPIIYRLVWKIYSNDFETGNLKFRLTGTNGGITTDYATVPKTDEVIATYITIPPKVTQTYTLSFRFEGTYTEQNIDQGRTFSAIVNAEYDD